MTVNIFVPENEIDKDKYFIVTYRLKGAISLRNAAWDLAVGQSIGNPAVRSIWETEQMFQDHTCKILGNEQELSRYTAGMVKIAFPLANINFKEDGISQLLCHIAGGQADIIEVRECHVVDVELPVHIENLMPKPKFGIEGIRRFTGIFDKPLLGGIVKPKVGMSPKVLLEVTKQMVDGGVNFIKEDEILGNPEHCPFTERVELISTWLAKHAPQVVYCFCINSDYPYVIDRVHEVWQHGGPGIHVNIWGGLGIYRTIRELDYDLFIHFQKSGDRFFTDPRSPYQLTWPFVCKIAGWSGADFIHAGMIGGYMNQSEDELKAALDVLWKYRVMPALSCGMHPGLVDYIRNLIGNDWMANVGGAMHGHPGGTAGGTLAMRQAIDRTYGEEYKIAVNKWGTL